MSKVGVHIIHGNTEILSEFCKSQVRIIHGGILFTETYGTTISLLLPRDLKTLLNEIQCENLYKSGERPPKDSINPIFVIISYNIYYIGGRAAFS